MVSKHLLHRFFWGSTLIGLTLPGGAIAASIPAGVPEIKSTVISSTARWDEMMGRAIAANKTEPEESLCGEPALSRLTRHPIRAGETLTSIAAQYNLIPATILGFNPALRNGSFPVGTEILIPPYNGVRVEAPAGSTWQDLAETYNIRASVLFEVNGCQRTPTVAFIPGVNWSPNQGTVSATTSSVLRGYPLPAAAPVITAYGWQLDPNQGKVVFNSGVSLSATQGTPVTAVGDGVVAFAGEQGSYGNLVVINHDQGLQTRYAQLESIEVSVGQRVSAGTRIGRVGETGLAESPRLHFEVRSNSALGWVAEDPTDYIDNLRFVGE